MRVVRSNNFVMATDQAPAQFRPGNQARLVRTHASNPSHAEAEAYAPNPGEARSGNLVGDNGLSKRSLRDHTAILRGSKTLPYARDSVFTVPMPTISGAPPRELASPVSRALTVPMPPADVRGMDGLGWGGGWAAGVTRSMNQAAPAPIPRWGGGGWAANATQAINRPAPAPIRRWGGGGWAAGATQSMNQAAPASIPRWRRGQGYGNDMRFPQRNTGTLGDRRMRFGDRGGSGPVAMFGLDGMGALDTSSLMLAAAAIAGVYFLTKNRRTA